jgi:Uma2 family endonuclease
MAVRSAAGATPPVLDDLVRERPPGHFTDADIEALPEGYGYEIVDGTLFVSPAPDAAHQLLVGELFLQLRLACPAELAVLLAPFDYKPDKDTTFEPDLLVARRADVVGAKRLERRPLLVVEVRSGRGLRDRTFKRVAYEEAGVPSYWIADPEEPSLTVLELDPAGHYAETARIAGDEVLLLGRPYPVELRLRNGYPLR